MQVKVQVISELRREFGCRRVKGGKGVEFILLCLDCDTETPLETFFEYVMTQEEREEYFGRLKDKIVMLGISQLRPTLGWNFQARGKMTVLSPLRSRAVRPDQESK